MYDIDNIDAYPLLSSPWGDGRLYYKDDHIYLIYTKEDPLRLSIEKAFGTLCLYRLNNKWYVDYCNFYRIHNIFSQNLTPSMSKMIKNELIPWFFHIIESGQIKEIISIDS
jgi:hypothetical protein